MCVVKLIVLLKAEKEMCAYTDMIMRRTYEGLLGHAETF